MRGSMIVTTAHLYQLAHGTFAVGAYKLSDSKRTDGRFPNFAKDPQSKLG